jgi:chemotaxis protein CheC
VNNTRLEQVAEVLGRPDDVVAAVLMHMMGDLTGRTMIMFPETRPGCSATYCCAARSGPPRNSDPWRSSGLKEAGNILSSAYLTALSDFMGMMLLPSVPSLVIDLSGAILTTTYLNFGYERDFVFCLETEFQFSDEFKGSAVISS